MPTWRKILGWVALPPVLAVGCAAAVLTFWGAAVRLDSLGLIVTLAAMTFASMAVMGTAIALPWLPSRTRILLLAVPSIFLAAWVGQQWFRPMGFDYLPAVEDPSIQYWQLPTGSRIAFRHREPSPGTLERRPYPVIFLHGGPGLPELPDAEVAAALSEAGFRVYGYHQFGAGLSSRAERPHLEYTVARHVGDLEAIRAQLGAERLILIGQSWGGALAANYAARFPERIEGLILTSPAPAWLPAFGVEAIRALGRLDADDQRALRDLVTPHIPRLGMRQRLAEINPTVADQWIGEREYAAFAQAQSRITAQTLACDPEAAADLVFPGQGGLVNRYVFADMERMEDSRPALKRVDAPVLLMRAECDYVDPAVIDDYAATFPRARIVEIDGAGHEILLERKDAYLRLVLEHLTAPVAEAAGEAALETGTAPESETAPVAEPLQAQNLDN